MSYTSAKQRPNYTFDALLEMTDAGLIASSAAGVVDSVAKVLDVGTARFDGVLMIDITACEADTGNESYRIAIEGSTTSGFSSGTEVELASRVFGDASIHGGDNDTGVGRYELPFSNIDADGLPYRYIRVYTTIAGTIATGINFTASIAKRN